MQTDSNKVFGSLAANGLDAPFRWNPAKIPANFAMPTVQAKPQGYTKKCVGHGTSGAAQAFLRDRGVSVDLSANFPYYNALAPWAEFMGKPVADTGTNAAAALVEACKFGLCSEDYHSSWGDPAAKPSDAAYADGATRRVECFERLGLVNWTITRDVIADMQVAMLCGTKPIVCIAITPSFDGISGPVETHPAQFTPGIVGDPNGWTHCMVFDAWTTLPDGQLLFSGPNSMGANWGDGGRFGITESQLRSCLIEAFAIRQIGQHKADIPMDFYRWAETSYEGQAFRLYRAALGRLPDPMGLMFQALAIEARGLPEVAGQFMASPEFQARFGAPDDAAFIRQLYENVLHRAPAPAEVQWYIDKRMSRVAMLIGFSESPENKAACAPAFERGVAYT